MIRDINSKKVKRSLKNGYGVIIKQLETKSIMFSYLHTSIWYLGFD